MRITLLLALIALAGARSVHKRNAYGDEPVVPSVPTEEAVAETPEEVPEPAPAPAEHVEEVPQQESGYRAKRGAQNGYGDEPVAPAAEESQPQPVQEAPEETPEEVPEAVPAPAEHVEEVPQQESGYRAKRGAQNGYGDEPVAPAAEESQPQPAQEAPEETPEETPEEVPEAVPAPAEHVEEVPQQESGYRAKRGAQNGYGDEPVAPAAEESQPEPAEETPEVVPEAAPAPAEHVEEVPQQESGYRAKRGAQNGYGDEPVAPAAEESQPQPAQEAPEETPEEVPEAVPAPAEHVEEVPQQESGYRAKRGAQNGYGDEPVAPAAEESQPQPAQEAPEETPEETPEEVPEAVPAPAEHVEEVPQQESGYRAKRGAQNGYGDEPVAPAAEESQPEPAEETPEVVPEAAPAPVEHVEEVPQQESGYRAKRGAQNGYGDEPVAPAAEESQPEPAEETPEVVPEAAPAPVEHVEEVPQQESGYRAKRGAQNGYGDEPVAPAAEESQPQPAEETPEEVPEAAPAPAEHVEEVPQQESGYRA